MDDESELTAVFQHFQKTSPMFKPFLNSWRIERNLRDFLSKSVRIVAIRLDREVGSPPLHTRSPRWKTVISIPFGHTDYRDKPMSRRTVISD